MRNSAKQDNEMIIDCDRCEVRGAECSECMVSVLLGGPPEAQLDAEQRRAFEVLADAGMVRPLSRSLVRVDDTPGTRGHRNRAGPGEQHRRRAAG